MPSRCRTAAKALLLVLIGSLYGRRMSSAQSYRVLRGRVDAAGQQ